MNLHSLLRTSLTVASFGLALTAQSPADDPRSPASRIEAPAPTGPLTEDVVPTPPVDPVVDRFLTPIHTAAADPEGGAYGIWAAGGEYKVSFHDRFTFVPYLGRAYPRTQTWTWTTTSVTRNGEPVFELTPAPQRRHTDVRYEYDFGGLVEAYDVRLDGVEQTFVLKNPVRGHGDLVVTGRVASDLLAAAVQDVVADLVFSDAEGRAILRYGKAVAIDANGERCQVTTSLAAGEIRLRLDGAWLDRASFPVVIDPLLTRESIAFWNTGTVGADGRVTGTAVAREDVNNQPMVGYTRNASATDSDLWLFLFDTDACLRAERHLVFSDITTSWGDESVNLATVGGGANARWIAAFVRPFPGASRGPRLHEHVLADTALSTTFSSIPRPGGTKVETIDVGGRNSFDSSSTCMLVYDRNLDTNADNLAVYGMTYTVAGAVFGTESLLSALTPATGYTNMRPKVNQVADQSGNDGWFVVWQTYWDTRGAPDDWDVLGRRVDETGALVGNGWVGSRSIPDSAHKLSPDVAGQGGRYAVTYAEWTEAPLTKTLDPLGGYIWLDRVDWPLGGSATAAGTCEVTSGFVHDRRWANDALAFDDNSRSHWALMLTSTTSGTQYAQMHGYDGGMTERVTAYSPAGTAGAFGGSLTYDNDTNYPAGRFLMIYATDEGSAAGGVETHPVYSHGFEHFAEVAPAVFGTGCGGTISAAGRILRGSDSFAVRLTGGPSSNLAALFLAGTTSAPVPAPFLLPGCFVNLGPTIGNVTLFTDAAGSASVDIDFPACSFLLTGPFHFQWVYLTPGGIRATRGLSIQIN